MNGLRRPTAARMLRVGALALLVCVCSATAASAATLHTAKQAALVPIKPTMQTSLQASLPQLAPPASGLGMPGVPNDFAARAAGTNSSLGAGQLVSGELLTASTTWVVPSFSCFLNSDNEILSPGLYLYNSVGAFSGYMLEQQFCQSGNSSAAYFFACSNTGCSSFDSVANPGDVMNAVYEQDATNSELTIFDRTQGTVASVGGTALLGGGYVLAGDLSPGAYGYPAVPTFSKISFSITTFDGFYISDFLPQRLNLQENTDVQIKGGEAKTTSFTTSFSHNY